MATTPRAFISFDFDHDDDLRNALVGQARYSNSPFFKPDEVDFFLSMGQPSMDALLKLWYTDENGSLSDCATQVFGPNSDINAWQKRHWDNFNRDACFKTKDWEYEHGIRVDGVADGGPSCQHQGGAFEGGGLGVGDGAVLGGFGQDVGHVSVVRGCLRPAGPRAVPTLFY